MDNSLVRIGLPSPNPEVEIQPGGFIRQKITGVYGGQEYTLEFQARGVETDARMRVLIRFLPTDQPVEESITLDSEMKGVSLKVQTLSDSRKLVITLGPDEGSAAIRVRAPAEGEIVLGHSWCGTREEIGRPEFDVPLCL